MVLPNGGVLPLYQHSLITLFKFFRDQCLRAYCKYTGGRFSIFSLLAEHLLSLLKSKCNQLSRVIDEINILSIN